MVRTPSPARQEEAEVVLRVHQVKPPPLVGRQAAQQGASSDEYPREHAQPREDHADPDEHRQARARRVVAADEVAAAGTDVGVLVERPFAEGADDGLFDVAGLVGVLIRVERILVDGIVVIVVAIVFVNGLGQSEVSLGVTPARGRRCRSS